MKSTRLAALLAVFGSACLLGMGVRASAVELLSNPGWEDGAPNRLVQPSNGDVLDHGWLIKSYLNSNNFRPENRADYVSAGTNRYHSGGNAIRTSANNATTGGYWDVYQEIPVLPNSSYSASTWVLPRDLTGNSTGFGASSTDNAALIIQELDSNDNVVVDHTPVAVTTASADWVQLTDNFTTSASTSKVRFIQHTDVLQRYDKTLVSWDDASLDGPPAVGHVEGTVTSNGTNISGAAVSLTSGNTVLNTTTNGSGQYSFPDMASGPPVEVRVTASGYYAQRKTRSMGGGAVAVDFDLVAIGSNLLVNAGFDDLWNNGWNSDTNRGNAGSEGAQSPNYTDSGEDGAALWSGSGGGDASVWQTAAVQPSSPYTAKAQFYPAGTGSQWGGNPDQIAYMFVKEYDTDGKLVLEHAKTYPATYSGWQTLTDSFNTQPQTAFVQVGGFAYIVAAGVNTGRAVFDSFELNGAAGGALPNLQGVVTGAGTPLQNALAEILDQPYSMLTTAAGHYEFGPPLEATYTTRAGLSGYYSMRKTRTLNGPDILSFDLVPVGSNLLFNPGFDDGAGTGWTSLDLVGNPVQASESSEKQYQAPYFWSGEEARRVYSDSSNLEEGEIYQEVPVAGGQSYTARVRFRPGYRNVASSWGTDPNQKGGLHIIEMDAARNVLVDHAKVLADFTSHTRDEWQTLTETFNANANTAIIRVAGYGALVDNHSNTLSRAIFDDFELTGTGPAKVSNVAAVKSMAEGSMVYVTGRYVTASFGDNPNQYFYIEDPDRSAGIKVTVPADLAAPTVGELIQVFGKVETPVGSGEKQITGSSFVRLAGGNFLTPLSMNNRAAEGYGLSAVGLLVTVWGKVDATGGNVFTITDGAGTALKVYGTSGYDAAPNSYVVVTGALGAEMSGQNVVSVLRATGITAQ